MLFVRIRVKEFRDYPICIVYSHRSEIDGFRLGHIVVFIYGTDRERWEKQSIGGKGVLMQVYSFVRGAFGFPDRNL